MVWKYLVTKDILTKILILSTSWQNNNQEVTWKYNFHIKIKYVIVGCKYINLDWKIISIEVSILKLVAKRRLYFVYLYRLEKSLVDKKG